MKKNLLYALLITAAFMVSCGDDEPQVDPIVGTWEMFNVSGTIAESDFGYLEFADQASLFGESVYSFQFDADGTYERLLEGVQFTNGSTGNLDDTGEWEVDGDDLELDADGAEVSGLSYEYNIAELAGNDLRLEYQESDEAFSATKLNEWIDAGILVNTSEGLAFTDITQEQLDSLHTNFLEPINWTFSLKFDKQ